MSPLAIQFATRGYNIKGKQCHPIRVANNNSSLCSTPSSFSPLRDGLYLVANWKARWSIRQSRGLNRLLCTNGYGKCFISLCVAFAYGRPEVCFLRISSNIPCTIPCKIRPANQGRLGSVLASTPWCDNGSIFHISLRMSGRALIRATFIINLSREGSSSHRHLGIKRLLIDPACLPACLPLFTVLVVSVTNCCEEANPICDKHAVQMSSLGNCSRCL